MDEYLSHYSENQDSEIPKNSSSNLATKISIKDKEHYLCKDCKTFHLIDIFSLNTIKILCNKKEIDSKDLASNILKEENLDSYQFCLIHTGYKKIGFCSECKSDLCQECIKLKNCKNNQNHSYIDFKTKDKEISNKENFISDYFDKKIEYNKKTNRDRFEGSEKKSEENISEKIEFIEMENNQEVKKIQVKNLTESIEDIVSLKGMFDLIEKSKEKIPCYTHYENIIKIYHFLCDKLKLKYYSFSNNQTKIRLFGEIFIKNNINKCSVMINNKLKKLEDCEFYELKKIDDKLTIDLLKEDDITDMSYMFNDCEVLQSISEGSKWSTNNVVNMSYMFCNCKALTCFPDISNWDTSKVTDMSNMFSGCESLSEIKGISNWDTSKVESMNKMFYECNFLENLENIMKWNTTNVINMSYMFYNCLALKSINGENEDNDESNWNTEKVENMSYMFYGCQSLKKLPDSFSALKTSKVEFMMYMFYNCKSLKSLPDISKWETKNVSYMNDMFGNCSSLESLPDISKWNIDSLSDISFIFEGCKSLNSNLNLSKWNKIKIKKGKIFPKFLN